MTMKEMIPNQTARESGGTNKTLSRSAMNDFMILN